MDKILLHGAHLDVHLGVPDTERSIAQTIVVDLELYCDTRKAGASDHFHDTIDYSAVQRTVRRVATERPHALVEALAERIATAVLAEFPVSAIGVRVRKPAALRDRMVDYAGVEILRERHG